MEKLVIIGVSETAERILYFCEHYHLYDVIGFSVDSKYRKYETFHNRPVWDLEKLNEHIDKDEVKIFVAIFWNHLNGDRRRLYERLKVEGYQFANIISPKASVRGNIGDNCWLMDFVIVQEGATVGNNVIMADFCHIANMAVISNHVFCGVRSSLMGGVRIGEQTFIGTGASVLESIMVGEKCVVGACTYVKQDIKPCSVIKADVSNNIVKHYSEDEIENRMLARYKAERRKIKELVKNDGLRKEG